MYIYASPHLLSWQYFNLDSLRESHQKYQFEADVSSDWLLLCLSLTEDIKCLHVSTRFNAMIDRCQSLICHHMELYPVNLINWYIQWVISNYFSRITIFSAITFVAKVDMNTYMVGLMTWCLFNDYWYQFCHVMLPCNMSNDCWHRHYTTRTIMQPIQLSLM